MINMGYCRFENTADALDECVYALRYDCPESDSEKAYAEKLRRLCEEYIEEHDKFKKDNGL